MKLFSAPTKGDNWLSLDPTVEPESPEHIIHPTDRLKRLLLDFLRSEHLVVLAGLGTSLYVPNAPKMTTLWEGVKASHDEKLFDDIVKKVNLPHTDGKPQEDIELLLSNCHLCQAIFPDDTLAKFISKSQSKIVEMCSFVTESTDLSHHDAFLRRIARRSVKSARSQVFTTNYDLCIESSAQGSGFVVLDGFSFSHPGTFDSSAFSYDIVRRTHTDDTPAFIPNVFHLYKLHGSVNWHRNGVRVSKEAPSPPPMSPVSKEDPSPASKEAPPPSPVMIFPRHTKFESSYEPPFLDLMAAFQAALRRSNTSLLIIGFGFNDKHIAEPIMAAIRSNVELRLVVVDPLIEKSENSYFKRLRQLVTHGDARITLLAAKFEEFVQQMPDVIAETELERHEARQKKNG
jgi:hypothetical protein